MSHLKIYNIYEHLLTVFYPLWMKEEQILVGGYACYKGVRVLQNDTYTALERTVFIAGPSFSGFWFWLRNQTSGHWFDQISFYNVKMQGGGTRATEFSGKFYVIFEAIVYICLKWFNKVHL